MPEAVQFIELKSIGTHVMFALIAIIVSFSIVNTFMMTVFERTPEFGMLMAIGMKPGRIMGQLATEALCLALLGVFLGLLVSALLAVAAHPVRHSDACRNHRDTQPVQPARPAVPELQHRRCQDLWGSSCSLVRSWRLWFRP